MRRLAPVRSALAAALLVAGSCTPAGDAPPAAPEFTPPHVIEPAMLVEGLKRKEPLDAGRTVSAVIGIDGGKIEVKGTGLTMIVPAGAVVVPTEFRVTARPGSLVAYEFEPHGAVFAVPLRLRQDLRGTSLENASADSLAAGYFKDALQLSDSTGTAWVDEILPIQLDLLTSTLEFGVLHFSGYLVSTGRGMKQ